MSWSPTQYLRFEDDRTRPVRDLLAAVPPAPVRVAVDLGCGPGNSTELLAARCPGARVLGIDSSAEMIVAARQRLPAVDFTVADIGAWRPTEAPDLVLANAVLHWLPDHPALLPRLAGGLAPGGTLAVQMPDNLNEPAYQAMRAVAAEGPWSGILAAGLGQRGGMASAEAYYAMLRPCCARVDVWRTTYNHVLPSGPDAVVEWFKGSGLRPYLDPLDETMRAGYMAAFRERIGQAYPAMRDGSVLLPFPRLFIVATR